MEIPFTRHRITLRLTEPVRFHFLHGGVVFGLLCRALETHKLPAGFVPYACESGRVRFRAGDSYRFGLTLAGEARALLDRLPDGLQRLARNNSEKQASNVHRPGALPTLAGNFEVAAIDELPEVPTVSSDKEGLRLQFVSPLRLRRPSDLVQRGAAYLNGDCFPAGHFLDRLWRRLFLIAKGRYPQADEAPPAVGNCTASGIRLLWIDMPVPGPAGKHKPQPKGYTLGGVLGSVRLHDLPEEWLPLLALGRHLHAGENIHYGLGAYRVGPISAADPLSPSRSYWSAIADLDLLDEAALHVQAKSEAAGVDNVDPEDFVLHRHRYLPALIDELARGHYEPPPLRGFIDRKKSGGVRALAIPTVADRVVQRAAAQLLGEAVDTLLEDCSYAYRKGFSRNGASRAIQRAYEEGYRYVLDADISAFFDSVDWDRLLAKVRALFPFEPLTELIEEWVKAPVVFGGKTLERTRGLPQGSPVAPLLANLFLDELDEELLEQRYRLIRYADDFVVLCKSLEDAQVAKGRVQEALDDLGLTLHPEKTEIRSFDSGFDYLGYLFCRSLVLERKKNEEDPGAIDAADIPKESWLARVPLQRIQQLERHRGDASGPVVPRPLALSGVSRRPLPLYAVSHDTELSLRGDSMLVKTSDGLRTIPLEGISQVVFVGRPRATVPLLLALGQAGISCYFCRRGGQLRSVLHGHDPDWPLWMTQAQAAEDPTCCLAFARAVVAARLHNMAALAVRFDWTECAARAADLRLLEQSCGEARDMGMLLGLEGRGAAFFFEMLTAALPAEWGFAGREKRPPPDPVNAMLSFGYTLLHNHIATALTIAGLNPRIGLYHHPRGQHQALASDLQEELRHLVEALVWSMASRRETSPDDFAPSVDGRYPSLMKPDLRRRFLEAFEARLATFFTPEGGEKMSYRRFLHEQAAQVRDFVRGDLREYRPLRIDR